MSKADRPDHPRAAARFNQEQATYAPADGGKMIDRDQPEKSDLLQYALPKVTAIHAHPGTLEVHKFPLHQGRLVGLAPVCGTTDGVQRRTVNRAF